MAKPAKLKFEFVKEIVPTFLIEEVRVRPVLYNHNILGVTSAHRRSAWFEICDVLIENFSKMNLAQQETTCKEVQSKWKGLRDSYRRALRMDERDTGFVPTKKQRFYFEKLNFLNKFCSSRIEFPPKHPRDPNNSSPDQFDESMVGVTTSYSPETIQNPDSPEYIYANQDELPPTPDVKPNTAALIFPQVTQQNPLKRKLEVDQQETPDKSDLTPNILKVLEQLVQIQRDEKEDNFMGNKVFLLSLLPFMENLSNEQNLQVRTKFINILQTSNNAAKS